MNQEKERWECAMQTLTAFALLKLLKAEGNPAAELLIYDIKAAGIARTFRGINEAWRKRKSIFAGAKLLGPLV